MNHPPHPNGQQAPRPANCLVPCQACETVDHCRRNGCVPITTTKPPEALRPPACAFEFPPMNEDLRGILGTMCFQCIHIAQGLRADGQVIRNRAEDEQAAVLHWLLVQYFRHGDDWRQAAGKELQRMAALMEEQKKQESANA